MFMKSKRLLPVFGLVTMLGLGVGVGLASAQKPVEKAEATYSQGDVISNDKARVWIGYDTTNPFTSYADEMKIWTHKNPSDAKAGEKIYTLSSNGGSFNNGAQSNRRYDYFDIDLSDYTNGWYLTVQKFQDGSWKAQTNSIQLSSTNAFMVYFVWGDWSWDATAGTVAAGSIDSVDAGMAAKALGGMHTCSSSNINGYGAFPNFESTFIKNGESWKTVGNLNDYTINDYATKDTSYSGEAATETNAYDKYLYVQEMYATNGNPRFAHISEQLETNNNSMIIVVATVTAVSATALGGYFFFRKRKEF